MDATTAVLGTEGKVDVREWVVVVAGSVLDVFAGERSDAGDDVKYVNGYKQSKGEYVGGEGDVSLYNVIGMVVLNPCNVMDPLAIVGVWIPKEEKNLDL